MKTEEVIIEESIEEEYEEFDLGVTPVFDMLAEAVDEWRRIIVSRGGTRSSKTYSTMQLLIIRLWTGYLSEQEIESGTCTVVREHSSTIKATVLLDFVEIMDERMRWGEVRERYTENRRVYTSADGKRKIEFIGANNEQKLRWWKRDILYCNEANELMYKKQFFQLNIRTSRLTILDFNPDDPDIRINTEIEQKRSKKRKDVKTIVSTYKHNPYLPHEMIEEIESLKDVDPMLWNVYGKGMYGRMAWRIRTHFKKVNFVPEQAEYICHGLDFWFTNHECALVSLRKCNGRIYVKEEFYEKGMTNQDISERMEDMGMDKDVVTIYADSAEPKSIQEIYNEWWDIYPVEKGGDSVGYGITLVKQLPMAYTSDSINVDKELRKRIRMKDKNGENTNKPIKKFDHLMDAIRYAVVMVYGKNDEWDRWDFTKKIMV